MESCIGKKKDMYGDNVSKSYTGIYGVVSGLRRVEQCTTYYLGSCLFKAHLL